MYRRSLPFALLLLSGLLVGAAGLSVSPIRTAHAYEEPRTVDAVSGIVFIDSEHGGEIAVSDTQQAESNFPQLRFNTYPRQVFWLAIFFTILYVLMSKIALPRVEEVLNMRQSQKAHNLDRALSLQAEAEKVEKEYEKALASAQDAAQVSLRAAEQKIADKVANENAQFAEQARKKITQAETNIQSAKDKALTSLADISAEVTAEIVNKITGAQLTKADAKKAVTTVMQEG